MRIPVLAAVLFAGLSAAPASASPDGKALFAARCGACHNAAAAKSSLAAPRIAGVAARKIASLPDYGYSTGLKAKGGQAWTDANLDAYLASSAKFAPGTRMMVAIAAPADRKAIIGYLKTLK